MFDSRSRRNQASRAGDPLKSSVMSSPYARIPGRLAGFAAQAFRSVQDLFKALDLRLCVVAMLKTSSLAVFRVGRTRYLGQSYRTWFSA
jgi:hypothetical protein